MVNEGRLVNEKRRALVNDIYERYTTEIENSFVNKTICENNDLRSKRVTGTKQTDIVFEHMDSVSAVMKYAGEDTAILNFANYETPGGGFLYGAMAQEEALCLESTLYPVISNHEFYYKENRQSLNYVGVLYSNRALWSPGIVFFRDGKEKYCDVITCAAPNASAYLSAGGSKVVNEKALYDRICFIIDEAVNRGTKTLILGAFGCGVFGQSPYILGYLYRQLLQKEYNGVFDRVVFAVIDEATLNWLRDGFEQE